MEEPVPAVAVAHELLLHHPDLQHQEVVQRRLQQPISSQYYQISQPIRSQYYLQQRLQPQHLHPLQGELLHLHCHW